MRTELALVAPTGAGKSLHLLTLAEDLAFEVISADSVQAVQGFDIGSAKPSADERRRLPHHLIDVAPPNERYDAGRFAKDAAALLAAQPHKDFVLTAGTGLYLQALTEGLPQLSRLPAAERDALTQTVIDDPVAAQQKLQALDPARAAQIHVNDWRRLARALEIAAVSGQPPSQVMQNRQVGPVTLRYVGIWAEGPAYECALRERVLRMLAAGWVDEVERLIARFGDNLPLLEAVGYKQIERHLRGDLSPAQLPEEIFLATRRYAKRQRTWFRKRPVTWFDYRNGDINRDLLAAIRNHFNERAG